ncbi:TATA element modulatory factor 1 TATA binding-domain-containing protein [Syncephalis fuscata]|nr:TATA element modulatory factor 1 TATA binding-domain-containing protein [Syncephalis fuscata]
MERRLLELTKEVENMQLMDKHHLKKEAQLADTIKIQLEEKEKLEKQMAELKKNLTTNEQQHKAQIAAMTEQLNEQKTRTSVITITSPDQKLTNSNNDRDLPPNIIALSPSLNHVVSDTTATSLTVNETEQERRASISTLTSNPRQSMDSVRSGTSADPATLNIRRLEGQVTALQAKLQQMSRSKEEMLDQLVEMTRRAEKLDDTTTSLETIEFEQAKLRNEYESAQTQIKEQTTEIAELKADIVDMKEVYRQQVSNLINKIEEYSRMNSTIIGGSS